MFPSIKVLLHHEEEGAEVEATLDQITIGCSVGLVSKVVSLTNGVTVTVVTELKVCLVGGTLDPVEGSLEILSRIFDGYMFSSTLKD
nr:hypothetical protein CFP56_62970 [Quercus suber]